ncbi:MAG: phytoene desaturase family protein [Chloroflexota bacterium]
MHRDCLIVGAGLGGLATAIRLRSEGWNVTVLEKNAHVGGRCSVLQRDGFTFDMGPTLLLMRDVLDDLFQTAGRNLDDYVDLIRVHPNYRVQFSDGSGVEFSSDLQKMTAELDALEPGAGDAFRRYIADAGYKYRISRERFVERNFLHWYNFATLTNLYYLFTTNTLRKLDRHASRYFHDPRLVAAVTFQTMYLGLAPHDAPAVYSLLPYTEIEEGIWFPRGGMYRIVEALMKLAGELGVCIETDAEVTGLITQNKRVTGVHMADGAYRSADVVVSNADLPYAYDSLVPDGLRGRFNKWRMPRLDFGSSAFLMYLGVDREYPQLHHHDVFLSADIVDNFDAIFRRFELPKDPSFYLCTASRTDRSLAPPGKEGIYMLVPVPRLTSGVDWNIERETFRDRMYDRLESVGLGDIRQHVIFEETYTPLDFSEDYNLMNGSAFGISHGFTQVGYMRPSNKASHLDNLYFVGASTQPGGGIPMVVLGSRLTAERIAQDTAHA